MPAWFPEVKTIEESLAEEQQRLFDARQKAVARLTTPILPPPSPTPSWLPTEPQIPQEAPPTETQMPSFMGYEPQTTFAPPEEDRGLPPWTQNIMPRPLPAQVPQEASTSTPVVPLKETGRVSSKPWEIDKDLPLWAKTLKVIGMPFEVIQDYLFNPVLGVAHQPWAQKSMTPGQLQQASREGISSYFPGGARYEAYNALQYPGKFVVELLPWLLVPPIGTVGLAGAGGKGIAGALSKLGKVGEVAGRTLEYSPAGLTEKAVGGVIGAVTGKIAGKVAAAIPPTVQDPLIAKAIGAIKEAQSKLPEQAVLTHELRVQQINKALPALQEGTGEQSLINFMGALKGQGEKVGWQGIRTQLTQDEINTLSNMIRDSAKVTGFDKAPAISGWHKILDGGQLPFDSELQQLEKVFGPEMVQSLVEKQRGNIINKISDIANAPRAVLSAVDFSGGLRQGGILTARHPIESAKTVAPMLKSFFSTKNAALVDDIIRQRPNTALAEDMGLYLAPLPGKTGPLSKMEESFMSRWIETVPVIGPAVKASNRAYVTGLNDLRSRVWESTLSSWQKAGATIGENDYKQLATLINAASGRGSLPKALQGASPLFNATLFSPRLLISRLQFPTMLASSSPLVRKEAAKQLVSFLGAGTAILSLAKLGGASIETDPRSSDFAKIKIGNTRLDIWSGYVQWARFMAQLTTAERKTQFGNMTDLNRREVIDRLMSSKYSPAFGLINDILRGESYSGEDVSLDSASLQRQAFTRLAPLFIQDMIDAIDQEGLIGGVVASPGLFGVGVVTYVSPAQKLRDQRAQETYGMSWDQVGKQKGMEAQLGLERSSPQLLAEIQKEREAYNKSITGKADINNIYRTQTETIEKTFKDNVNLAAKEYRDTGDGYTFKEKILKIADNRRSQYDVLNANPQFSNIVARYDELPTAADLKKMSPQDWARKEYMRLIYSKDMYDQYGNYRFDMVDDMKELFVKTFGQGMLDYVETYQNTRESDMPQEYQDWRQATRTMKPYWEIQTQVEKMFGAAYAESSRGQALIQRQRKMMRMANPAIAQAFAKFYARQV